MLEGVAVHTLVDVKLIPVFVRECSGENASARVRIARPWNGRFFIDSHLMVLFEVFLHKVIVEYLKSMTLTLILKTEVLKGEQPTCK